MLAESAVQVNAALREELQELHALSFKHCWTPEQEAQHAVQR